MTPNVAHAEFYPALVIHRTSHPHIEQSPFLLIGIGIWRELSVEIRFLTSKHWVHGHKNLMRLSNGFKQQHKSKTIAHVLIPRRHIDTQRTGIPSNSPHKQPPLNRNPDNTNNHIHALRLILVAPHPVLLIIPVSTAGAMHPSSPHALAPLRLSVHQLCAFTSSRSLGGEMLDYRRVDGELPGRWGRRGRRCHGWGGRRGFGDEGAENVVLDSDVRRSPERVARDDMQ